MTTTTTTTRRRPVPITVTAAVDIHAAAAPVLKLSADRKVAPLVRRRKHRAEPLVLNAFGLPAGPVSGPRAADGSCPDATDACIACYAAAIPYPSVSALLAHNYAALLACGDDVDAMVALLAPMVAAFAAAADARGADRVFRIHWSGDYFNDAYAAAWVVVARMFPTVQFWHYTRSFQSICAAQIFAAADLPNVVTYLSIDNDNAAAAAPILAAWPHLRAAALGQTFAAAAAVLTIARADAAARAPKCPENAGRLPLTVTADRRRPLDTIGEDGVGACVACGMCVFGRRDVLFSTSGR